MMDVFQSCPDDDELSPAVFEDALDAQLEQHLRECSGCARRVTAGRLAVESLRETAVRSHLDSSDGQSLPAINQLLMRAAGTARSTSPQLETEQEVPTSIGKYRVIRMLSSGGQGTVYHAWHPGLQREVAVKLCRHAVTPERQERFFTEGMLLGRISHPGLAQVYDIDVHEGRPYLVMEYVRGYNLRQTMRMVRLSLKCRMDIMRQLAVAVAAAHQQGILHLDLKPENVMLYGDNQVKLIDLGMSWLLPRQSTELREVVGTFEYMAPEQLSGNAEQWSCRTDVFGLGAVLFFLLANRPPVSRRGELTPAAHERALQASIVEIQQQGGLGHVCGRALRPAPHERFADVDELIRSLDRSKQRNWLGPTLVAAGLLSLVISLTPLSLVQSATQEPVSTRSGCCEAPMALHISVDCHLVDELQFFACTPTGAVRQIEGMTALDVDGIRTYSTPGGHGLLVKPDSWAVILAVKSQPGVTRDSIAEILGDLQRFQPLALARAEFDPEESGQVVPGVHTEANPLGQIELALRFAHIAYRATYVSIPGKPDAAQSGRIPIRMSFISPPVERVDLVRFASVDTSGRADP